MVLFKVMLYNPSIFRPPENAVGDLTRVAPCMGYLLTKCQGIRDADQWFHSTHALSISQRAVWIKLKGLKENPRISRWSLKFPAIPRGWVLNWWTHNFFHNYFFGKAIPKIAAKLASFIALGTNRKEKILCSLCAKQDRKSKPILLTEVISWGPKDKSVMRYKTISVWPWEYMTTCHFSRRQSAR